MHYLKRFAPLIILILLLCLAIAFDVQSYLTFEKLRDNRLLFLGFVQEHPILAPLLYAGFYILVVSLALPGATILTITAGFLFGYYLGMVCVVFSATVGACILFVIARSALGNSLRKRAGGAVKKMAAGFQEDAFNYLLVLRIVPLFPFFLVNLVPAFLGVPLRIFASATFLGIIPGSFVYVSIGIGLGSVFDAGEKFNLESIITVEILAALSGLGLLALIPVLYKWIKKIRRKP